MVDWIIDVTCKDRSYGARPLRRAIQRYVEDPLSEELIRGNLADGEVEVYIDAGQIVLPARRGSGNRRWRASWTKSKSKVTGQRSGPGLALDLWLLQPAAGRSAPAPSKIQ